MSVDRKPEAGQPGDAEEGGFLSRWSRRKRDVAAKEAVQQTAPQTLPQTLPPIGDATSQPVPDRADEPALSEVERAERRQRELDELIASLPKVEEIDASTDVTGFLDARIPDALRNAALRQTWISDPTIRDFLNDAREYALDYNTPGMAPGYGQLSESEKRHAAEFVKSLFSSAPEAKPNSTLVEDKTQPKGEISDQESRVESAPSVAEPRELAAPGDPSDAAAAPQGDDNSVQQVDSRLKREDSAGLEGDMEPQAESAAPAQVASSLPEHAPIRRRGGGALPI